MADEILFSDARRQIGPPVGTGANRVCPLILYPHDKFMAEVSRSGQGPLGLTVLIKHILHDGCCQPKPIRAESAEAAIGAQVRKRCGWTVESV